MLLVYPTPRIILDCALIVKATLNKNVKISI